jgi:hypothetical protein
MLKSGDKRRCCVLWIQQSQYEYMFILKAARFFVVFFCGLCILIACTSVFEKARESHYSHQVATTTTIDSNRIKEILPLEIQSLKNYLKKYAGKYSSSFAFFIDMKIPSAHYRFFVVDLAKDSIVGKGLVAHGSGSETEKEDSLQFSNTPNSYMTSLGTYKIGAAYMGNFGRSYKLHGLESSNSKALERYVVLHRYSCVPDEEQYSPICNSLGCPMVSENFFLKLDAFVKAERLPVLMKIYY